jgi:hypothetical protein
MFWLFVVVLGTGVWTQGFVFPNTNFYYDTSQRFVFKPLPGVKKKFFLFVVCCFPFEFLIQFWAVIRVLICKIKIYFWCVFYLCLLWKLPVVTSWHFCSELLLLSLFILISVNVAESISKWNKTFNCLWENDKVGFASESAV